ncbi:MAG: SpoIIE family protein phosphatase [Deltaproteobacteria bacterium]|nr:SpoIIE family protein phosphatase [Deltaproteobacteria bacterium]
MAYIKRSLFFRLALLILGGGSLVVLAIVAFNHFQMRRNILADQERYYTALASSAAAKFSVQLMETQKVVDEAAALFTTLPRTRATALSLLKKCLRLNRNIYGSAIALAPLENDQEAGFRILYAWREGERIRTMERSQPEQDYQSDWFSLPYYLSESVWTDPYVDADVDTLMITYCTPVRIGERTVAVITCDLALKDLQTSLSGLELGRHGKPMLVSRFGKLILHPRSEWMHKETFVSLAEGAKKGADRDTLLSISRSLSGSAAGSFRFRQIVSQEQAWLYFDSIPLTGWKIGFIIPEKQILAPVVRLGVKTLLIAVCGILLLLPPAFFIARTITRPLKALSGAADQLAQGDFGVSLPAADRTDEIGRLIAAFDRMRTDLKSYIGELTRTTAEKEKIASELSIACEIQHSILPKIFPPFPQRSGLDLYATLSSAREVGGDLYDFTLLDDDHLYFCIGDVSGKGVPASLFMAVGKTLLKSTIQTLQDPAKTLFHVNNELSQGNENCMFITTFCGILDLRTNELIYANAGHNPPVLFDQHQARFLDSASSPPLAAMPDSPFRNERLVLPAEAKLLLYTDGVTEAMNPQLELFGEERLLAFLREQPPQTAEGCVSMLSKRVRGFAQGAEQSDDITLLCISYRDLQHPLEANDTSPTSLLILTNHTSELPRMVAWLEDLQTRLGWSYELTSQLNLILEEWLVNVISYAFADDHLHEIEIRLWQDEAGVRMEVSDDGAPFDPTAQKQPDLDAAIEDRPIGGLGIHFIRTSLDELRYARTDGRNVVTMIKQKG